MTPSLSIIIPIRSLTDSKTRLSGVLEPFERARLNEQMLRGVVWAALGAVGSPAVIVTSEDPEALEVARDVDPRVVDLQQSREAPGLNGALEHATRFAIDRSARAVLVLPADLPLVRSADIDNVLRRDAPIVIAPDRHRRGTNGLMQRIDATRGHFRYQFGIESYRLHLDEAHRLGLDAATAISLGTSFDLDTPGDLDDLRRYRLAQPGGVEESVAHG
jgi:2-phospho-L-lactate/phosphoenolpyruvate guanylyltransferase